VGVTVRRLRAGDEQVLALIAADAPDFDLAGRTTPERPLTSGDAAAYLAEPNVLHWIAEDGDAVVGELLCHLLLMPSDEGRELLLYSIGVRSRHRRRGVGAALLDEMRHWMRDAGVQEAWVLADNPGAEAFYAARGFTRGGEGEQGTLMLLRVPGDRGDA
jgi:ribosomal protein S18 acetylase RimI-like enzyme